MEADKLIYIIDYIGNSYNAEPIGHPLKSIKQVDDLLRGEYRVRNAVPLIYENKIEIDIKLDYYVDISDKESESFYRVRSLIKKIKNLKKIFNLNDGILFFVNTDITLFLYLIFSNKRRKIITINFNNYLAMNSFTGKLKKIIFKLANEKVNLQFNTYDLKSREFIPDFYYDSDRNRENILQNKEVDFLVIGTMNEAKDLIGIMNAVSNTNYSLRIIGKFYSDIYYNTILHYANNSKNITIVNKYLENDEYHYEILKAKFVILPYDINIYKNITSGVFLDAIYNNTPIIAPLTPFFQQFQLMKIGIIYNDMSEIIDLIKSIDYEELKRNISIFKEKQSKKIIQNKMLNLIQHINK